MLQEATTPAVDARFGGWIPGRRLCDTLGRVPGSPLLALFDTALVDLASEEGLVVGPATGSTGTFRFGELERRSNRIARALADRGAKAGDRLAVLVPNGVAFLDLFLACLKLGVVFVPLNVLYREREVSHAVADAEPVGFVTTAECAGLVPAGTPVWDVQGLEAEAAEGDAERPRATLEGTTAALIVYTSGTTGRAKGAVHTHASLARNARTLVEAWRITAADRYLAVLPLFHVHGLGNGACTWLATGCRMRLLERFEHETAREVFEAWRPTLFFGVPTVYVRLLELAPDAASGIGARARLFVSGSAALPARVFEAFRERFSHAILERYGMTETLMTLSNPYEGERRAGTVGRALPGVEVRIVGPDGDLAKEGEVGELLVRSPALFSGYWQQSEATAAAFVDGWFRTGDLAARAADGYITLKGRSTDLIISGGFNVYPREVEEVLLEQPGVREAAVVGVPEERRGEVPVACFAGDADPGALAAACRRELASFKVPRSFVRVAALPRNALGKVDKGRLLSLLES
jgi:malonyl-CoA/methylmalonyl-CoA synthetase